MSEIDTIPTSEAHFERMFERRCDALDKEYLTTGMTEDEYQHAGDSLGQWACWCQEHLAARANRGS